MLIRASSMTSISTSVESEAGDPAASPARRLSTPRVFPKSSYFSPGRIAIAISTTSPLS
jgi:hypothetical protein